MDIRIIPTPPLTKSRPMDNQRFLLRRQESMTTEIGTSIVPFSRIFYDIYNVKTNVKEEILPDIQKYYVADISFAEKNCPYLYFFCLNYDRYPMGTFTLYRYHVDRQECTEIYRFEDNLKSYASQKRLHLYVLSDNYLIFQTEYLTEIATGNDGNTSYSGFFRFSLSLYDISTGAAYPVKENMLARYGISQMIPVVSNVCALHVGYSLMGAPAMDYIRGEQAPYEQVWLVTISQLISDLLLDVPDCTKEVIDQAHDTHTLSDVKKMGQYLNYVRFDRNRHLSEIIFYQYITKEVLVLVDNHNYREHSVRCCVLQQRPYIARYTAKHLELMDIKNGTVSLRLSKDSEIIDILYDYIVLKLPGKGLLSGGQHVYEIYQYPSLQRFYRVKAKELQCISLSKQDINLLVIQ